MPRAPRLSAYAECRPANNHRYGELTIWRAAPNGVPVTYAAVVTSRSASALSHAMIDCVYTPAVRPPSQALVFDVCRFDFDYGYGYGYEFLSFRGPLAWTSPVRERARARPACWPPSAALCADT